MQAARRSPRSVAVDEIQQEVGLPHVTAGRREFSSRLSVTAGDTAVEVINDRPGVDLAVTGLDPDDTLNAAVPDYRLRPALAEADLPCGAAVVWVAQPCHRLFQAGAS
jgi:hypothetical protein